MDVQYPDGLWIALEEWGANGDSTVKPKLALTVDQMKAIALSPQWRQVVGS